MENTIDYYYSAIMKQINPEIEMVLNEEMNFIEKINAIAQLKMEAFKTASCVAGNVAVYLSSVDNE